MLQMICFKKAKPKLIAFWGNSFFCVLVCTHVCDCCTGEEVVSAVGCEVDRLEKDIQKLVPGIRHVDIEAHNPNGPTPREKFYLY